MRSYVACVALLLLANTCAASARSATPVRVLAEASDQAITTDDTAADVKATTEQPSPAEIAPTDMPTGNIPPTTDPSKNTEGTMVVADNAKNKQKDKEAGHWWRKWYGYSSAPSHPTWGSGCTSCGPSSCGGGCSGGCGSCGGCSGGCGPSPCGGCSGGCWSPCGGRKLQAVEHNAHDASAAVSTLKRRVTELEQQLHDQAELFNALQHQLEIVMTKLAAIQVQTA